MLLALWLSVIVACAKIWLKLIFRKKMPYLISELKFWNVAISLISSPCLHFTSRPRHFRKKERTPDESFNKSRKLTFYDFLHLVLPAHLYFLALCTENSFVNDFLAICTAESAIWRVQLLFQFPNACAKFQVFDFNNPLRLLCPSWLACVGELTESAPC